MNRALASVAAVVGIGTVCLGVSGCASKSDVSPVSAELASVQSWLVKTGTDLAAYNDQLKNMNSYNNWLDLKEQLQNVELSLANAKVASDRVKWPATPTGDMPSYGQIATLFSTGKEFIAIEKKIFTTIEKCSVKPSPADCVKSSVKPLVKAESAKLKEFVDAARAIDNLEGNAPAQPRVAGA